ncbi:hypothetical protein Q0M94_22900 (plasmid) [Deinococcus radiomollis]|uniref:hypothetical protein n=1 Tax=Deinococcus radiomollis TaxID=468916 RepID=UPI003891D873
MLNRWKEEKCTFRLRETEVGEGGKRLQLGDCSGLEEAAPEPPSKRGLNVHSGRERGWEERTTGREARVFARWRTFSTPNAQKVREECVFRMVRLSVRTCHLAGLLRIFRFDHMARKFLPFLTASFLDLSGISQDAPHSGREIQGEFGLMADL